MSRKSVVRYSTGNCLHGVYSNDRRQCGVVRLLKIIGKVLNLSFFSLNFSALSTIELLIDHVLAGRKMKSVTEVCNLSKS